MLPPSLSAASTDRMAQVVSAADAAVDEGTEPNAALAKAARDYGLPVGHVPLVVRAFNTARAVQQLGEKDVWAKAAAYPIATVEGVNAVLGKLPTPGVKQAANLDYLLPPDSVLTKIADMGKLDAGYDPDGDDAKELRAMKDAFRRSMQTQVGGLDYSSKKPTKDIEQEAGIGNEKLDQRVKLSNDLISEAKSRGGFAIPPGSDHVGNTEVHPTLYPAGPVSPIPQLTSIEQGPMPNEVLPTQEMPLPKPTEVPQPESFLSKNWLPIMAGGGVLGGAGLAYLVNRRRKNKQKDIASPVEDTKEAAVNRLTVELSAAKAYDEIMARAHSLKPNEYSALKKIAQEYLPEVAELVFPAIEADDWRMQKAANAKPSCAVGLDHPFLGLLCALDMARDAYTPVRANLAPEHYDKIASEAGVDLYRKRKICPILKLPIAPVNREVEKKAEAPQEEPLLRIPPAKSAADYTPDTGKTSKGRTMGIGSGIGYTNKVDALRDWFTHKSPKYTPEVSGFSRGMSRGLGLATLFGGGPLTARATDALTITPPDITAQKQKLQQNLSMIDTQASVQQLLEDPRFANANPGQVVAMYRQLQSVAPQAMSNAAIAADFIHRQMQTGPLSYFDLEKLTAIEKNLAQIKDYDRTVRDRDRDDD